MKRKQAAPVMLSPAEGEKRAYFDALRAQLAQAGVSVDHLTDADLERMERASAKLGGAMGRLADTARVSVSDMQAFIRRAMAKEEHHRTR